MVRYGCAASVVGDLDCERLVGGIDGDFEPGGGIEDGVGCEFRDDETNEVEGGAGEARQFGDDEPSGGRHRFKFWVECLSAGHLVVGSVSLSPVISMSCW